MFAQRSEVEIQVIERVRSLLANQVRYITPVDFLADELLDDYVNQADQMSDEDSFEYIKDKEINSNENLLDLAASITIPELFSENGWIDDVCDYIVFHKEDCYPLWNKIVAPLT